MKITGRAVKLMKRLQRRETNYTETIKCGEDRAMNCSIVILYDRFLQKPSFKKQVFFRYRRSARPVK